MVPLRHGKADREKKNFIYLKKRFVYTVLNFWENYGSFAAWESGTRKFFVLCEERALIVF
jgi:hypothetical protein